MQLPKPKMLSSAKRQLVTTFYGLDRTDLCGEDTSDGESYFSDMKNGEATAFPLPRPEADAGLQSCLTIRLTVCSARTSSPMWTGKN